MIVEYYKGYEIELSNYKLFTAYNGKNYFESSSLINLKEKL